jgi:uncharacterized membrane protein
VKFVKRQMGFFLYFFLYGVIFWLPIGIAFFIGTYIFGNFESTGKGFLNSLFPDRFVYRGLGIAIWLVLFFVTGLILKKTNISKFLGGIPLIGTLFRSGGTTITIDELMNLSPCLCLRSETCICYAFILWEETVRLGTEKADFDLIDVYHPHPPVMITGRVFSVRKGTIVKLGNKSSDIINMLLYGLRRPVELKYLPWEDETEEEFKERVKHFGLDMEPSPLLQSALDNIERKRRP